MRKPSAHQEHLTTKQPIMALQIYQRSLSPHLYLDSLIKVSGLQPVLLHNFRNRIVATTLRFCNFHAFRDLPSSSRRGDRIAHSYDPNVPIETLGNHLSGEVSSGRTRALQATTVPLLGNTAGPFGGALQQAGCYKDISLVFVFDQSACKFRPPGLHKTNVPKLRSCHRRTSWCSAELSSQVFLVITPYALLLSFVPLDLASLCAARRQFRDIGAPESRMPST